MSKPDESPSTIGSVRLGDDLSASAFRFAENAERCDDMAALCQATQQAALAVGMTAVASGLVSGPRRASNDLFHFISWPADWLELYSSQNYVDKDPVARWALVSGAPISWTDLFHTLSPDDPGHEVYRSAAKWGFKEGFVTPVRGLDGSIGLVSCGGARDRLLPSECLFLQSISATAFHRAELIANAQLNISNPVFQSLADREISTIDGASVLKRQAVTEANVRDMFGLTEAEWRVASALYKGESLQGLAATRKISVNTLRAQLASVFTKTETHRQAELVSVLRKALDPQDPIQS